MKLMKSPRRGARSPQRLPLPAAGADRDQLGHVGEPGSLFAALGRRIRQRANEKLGDKAQGRRLRLEPARQRRGAAAEAAARHRRHGAPVHRDVERRPGFGLFEMPYLVKDREHMKRIEEEIVWPMLAPAAEKKGYKVLAVWENGFRHITNNVRPIVTPEDLQGHQAAGRPRASGGSRCSRPMAPTRRRCRSRKCSPRCRPASSTARRTRSRRSPAPSSRRCRTICR